MRSYCQRAATGAIQIPRLVERAADVDVLVTPNVKDALLLENELIKQHKPPFNVRLRDDKQYLALRLDPREELAAAHDGAPLRERRRPVLRPVHVERRRCSQSLSNLRRIFPLRSCSERRVPRLRAARPARASSTR